MGSEGLSLRRKIVLESRFVHMYVRTLRDDVPCDRVRRDLGTRGPRDIGSRQTEFTFRKGRVDHGRSTTRDPRTHECLRLDSDLCL